MPKLSGEELLGIQAIWLTREMKTHERDEMLAQGKVQENKELLERVQNTCLYCGEVFQNWNNATPTRMEKHIAERHSEEVEPALPVDYMGEETKGESERSRA